VEGAALDLSHWRGNRTPAALKADTSTGIALRFLRCAEAACWSGAPVVNNHFDTDGVLSCWALMAGDEALRRERLLVAAAEAGDFSEWPEDPRGIQLDAAIVGIGEKAGDEGAAYAAAFRALPELLDEIALREDLWGAAWAAIQEAMRDVNAGRVEASVLAGVGVVRHPEGRAEIPGPVIARLLLDRCRRYLLAFAQPRGRWRYRYELPRYAWAETVTRPSLELPDAAALVRVLGAGWKAAEAVPGGTAVLETVEEIDTDPESVVAALESHDPAYALPTRRA
jgi:hypothetical protein